MKGGALLAAYGARRPTRDVDLRADRIGNDTETVLDLIREIAEIEIDDGLHYDATGAEAELIRDEDQYAGVRVTMGCALATARLRFHVDVNVGDPVWPKPGLVEVPRLLGGVIMVTGYPLSMVLAEKVVTALQRGTVNTRWRDFADIYLLTGSREVDGAEFTRSMQIVAEYRSVEVESLSRVLAGYGALGQVRWAAWVRKQRLDDRLPRDFASVVDAVVRFSDPALGSEVIDKKWNPSEQVWSAQIWRGTSP
ncbi:nucleotidyl transferase AbiEii/AbiGii toxin family protein [Kineosporia sp. NBRC 101731]|uniref:nucleotidyl transferase AbiEii/AbiGii toxin family protein n=1 Tax=Kineosporia sp. NBRC 101731 TaxID=3032199 RepID=UPI002557C09B|nr:nucleotidyl transferase AbiEii/AbiGii toxin family protein [Kineosporia sp. NBRC 101731]